VNEWFSRLGREIIPVCRVIRAIFHRMNHKGWRSMMMNTLTKEDSLNRKELLKFANYIDSYDYEDSDSEEEVEEAAVRMARPDRSSGSSRLSDNSFSYDEEESRGGRSDLLSDYYGDGEDSFSDQDYDIEEAWTGHMVNAVQVYYIGQGERVSSHAALRQVKRHFGKDLPGIAISSQNIADWRKVFGKRPDGTIIDRGNHICPFHSLTQKGCTKGDRCPMPHLARKRAYCPKQEETGSCPLGAMCTHRHKGDRYSMYMRDYKKPGFYRLQNWKDGKNPWSIHQ